MAFFGQHVNSVTKSERHALSNRTHFLSVHPLIMAHT